jgi:hypothetical protein
MRARLRREYGWRLPQLSKGGHRLSEILEQTSKDRFETATALRQETNKLLATDSLQNGEFFWRIS